MSLLDYTFAQVEDDALGTVYFNQEIAGAHAPLRFLVLKGGASCCAYVAVREDHPLVREMPTADQANPRLVVHGGVTLAKPGWGFQASLDSLGWFFWGWHYAHLGDKMAFPKEVRKAMTEARLLVAESMPPLKGDQVAMWKRVCGLFDRAWTPGDVWTESQPAIADVIGLMRWAEHRAGLRRIARSAKLAHVGKHMRTVLTARLPEPKKRPVGRSKLSEALGYMRNIIDMRVRKQKQREVRKLKKLYRGR